MKWRISLMNFIKEEMFNARSTNQTSNNIVEKNTYIQCSLI